MKKLLPQVFRTEKEIANFDPLKIQNSLIKETGLSEQVSREITEKVVRRIVSSGIRFLSGPHIREIVCSILSENNYEEERKLYTRIGMPLMDYEELFQSKLLSQKYDLINPEVIRHIAVNQLAEEYALLRLLDDAESKSHLSGDIHIHKLEFFDSSPMLEIWDPRVVIANGILYDTKSKKVFESGNSLKSILNVISIWLNLMRNEVSWCLGYSFLATFLAPIVKSMTDEEIELELYLFFKKIDLMRSLSGPNRHEYLFIFSLEILKELTDQYGEFREEHLKVLKIVLRTLINLGSIESHYIPKILLICNYNSLSSVPQELSSLISDPSLGSKLYFMMLEGDSLRQIFPKIDFTSKNLLNFGIVQHISINLPRIAYKASNRKSFLYLLQNQFETICNIHIKRKRILNSRINSGLLPFSVTVFNDEVVLEEKTFSIELIGFEETIEILHKTEGFELGSIEDLELYVLKFVVDSLKRLSTQRKIKLKLACFGLTTDARRFFALDSTHFSKKLANHFEKESNKYSKLVFRANTEFSSQKEKLESFTTTLSSVGLGIPVEKTLDRKEFNPIDMLKDLSIKTSAITFNFKQKKKIQ